MIKLASVFHTEAGHREPSDLGQFSRSHEIQPHGIPSVKMKGETMSDQQPIASLHNLWSKDIVLVAPRSRRHMLTLFAVDSILHEKGG